MPNDSRLTAPIAAALTPGVECLTATRRQMHELLRVQADLELAAGRSVWETARILPWDAGLAVAWADTTGRPETLLDETTARRLWRSIISDSATGAALIDPRAAARAARRSYVLAAEWGIVLSALLPATPEQEAFLGWARTYDDFLAGRGYLDRARLPRALAAQALSPDSAPLRLHGLQELPTQQAALIGAWRAAGRSVETVGTPAGTTVPQAMHFRTVEEELEGCLAWVLARLDADPQARLAVLWPDLKDRARALRRLLDDRLYPAALRAGAPPERPYALGSAPALADYGCVQAAFALLALALPRVGADQLGVVLRSPYLAGADEEAGARARLDARLRRDGPAALAAPELLRLLGAPAAGVPQLAALQRALGTALGGEHGRPLDAWAVAFGRALAASGWPGSRTLASDEHQTVEKFQAALGELASLARVLGPQPLAGALAELAEVAAGLEFQPESGAPSVVFLDGPAAVGYPLDGLWVAGLEAGRFPATELPDPFLPLESQRRAGLPAVQPGAGRGAAARLLADWRAWSGELVLSVAALDGTTEQRPSPVLRGLAEGSAHARIASYAELIRDARVLAPVPLSALPPLLPGAPLSGGSGALELQSACPFRAALRYRLQVHELEQVRAGVSPKLRGTLAHAALAALWQVLQSSVALSALDVASEQALVAESIDTAFRAQASSAPRGRLGRLEREWLATTMHELLAEDRKRPPFTVVAIEAPHTFDFEGHELRITLDRLDRMADGRTLLIDYKTGRHSTRRWLAERLADVQLPLYAAYLDEAPAAIAHAQLPLAAKRYAGLAAAGELLPGVGPARGADKDPALSFDALLARWRGQTGALAHEFIAGHAAVAPAPGACEYCPHGLVCRFVLDPGDLAGDALEADDDD